MAKKVVTLGEIMLRLSTPDYKRFVQADSFDVTYGGTMNSNDKGGKKAGFKLTGEIDRKDYGLTWAKTAPGGELVVSDKVQIVCRIEADKKV